MKKFDDGAWVQGEKPKTRSFSQWLKEGGYIYLTVGLVVVAVWWCFVGEQWLLGSYFHLPKHLW